MYVGATLRVFFEEEKPALLQQIDAEFEKVHLLELSINLQVYLFLRFNSGAQLERWLGHCVVFLGKTL